MLAGVISKHSLHATHHPHYTLTTTPRHRQKNQTDASFPTKLIICRSPYNYYSTFPTELNSNLNSNLNLKFSAAIRPAGEGSWNVAWDVRPARWLHRPYTAWLLFGICACLAVPPAAVEVYDEILVAADGGDNNKNNKIKGFNINGVNCFVADSETSSMYRITGVPADGRCLFRAIAHMVCLKNGEGAPDENRQRELADELRAQVVNELQKRRKEIEWFIEEDFDVYMKRIEKPYVWGGEPELLMASHVLKTGISVFMLQRSTQKLLNIATYGKEYEKDDKSFIKVLFHGYGHYDILEDV